MPNTSLAAATAKTLHHRGRFLSRFPLLSSSPPLATSSSSDTTDPADPVISCALSILLHRRSKSRWSTLLSLVSGPGCGCCGGGGGFNSDQVSSILLRLRNNPRLALSFFQFTLRHSLCSPPSLLSYSTIIHILARSRRLASPARSLIRDAIRGGLDDVHSFIPIVASNKRETYSGHREGNATPPGIFEALVRTYRVCHSTPIVFDLLIQACLKLIRIRESVHMVRMLRSRGFSLRIGTCNSLIDRVSKKMGCLEGYDLYKELFQIGYDPNVEDRGDGVPKLLPNVHTFNGLMLSFYRNEMFDRVEEVWTEMGSCEPNLCSYNILMAAYCDQGEIGKAWTLWEEITSKGLKRDAVAYNTLIGGYCELGMVERGEELYREMVMSGIEPTCLAYQHLILGYCRIGELDSALLLYKDMQRKSFTPSSSVVDAIVEGLCYVERVSEALNFFNAASKNDDFVAKKTSYDHLIKGLCVGGKLKEALKLQAQMVGKGFLPDSDTYYAFIDCCEKHGKPDMAEKLRKEMVQTLALQNNE